MLLKGTAAALSLGDDDLATIQFVGVAEIRVRLRDDATHDLVAVEPLAGCRVHRDHLTGLELPVLTANAQELAAHEDVLAQIDKASGGKTVWRRVETGL